MRLSNFIKYLQDELRVHQDVEARRILADAMAAADRDGQSVVWLDGVKYAITAEFKHGCINYDCNPATCYTEWTITREV